MSKQVASHRRDARGATCDVLCAVSVAGTACAVATGICLAGSLQGRPGPAAVYLVAVCVSAYFCGWAAGILAVLLSYLAASWFVLEPVHTIKDGTGAIVFVAALALAAVPILLLLRRESALKRRYAQAFDREQRTRHELDAQIETRRRLETEMRFLASASEALASSLDLDRTIAELSRLAVPELADWCRVELIDDPRLDEHARSHEHGQRGARSEAALALCGSDRLEDGDGTELPGLGTRAIVVPLIVADRRLGTMMLVRESPDGSYGPDERRRADDLARRATAALENAILHRDAERARTQAEASATRMRRLQTIVDATFSSSRSDDFLHELVSRLKEAVAADMVAVLVVEEGGDALLVRHAIGQSDGSGDRSFFGQGLAGQVAVRRAHLYVRNLAQSSAPPSSLDTDLVSSVGAPMIAGDRLVGVLQVGSRSEREFDAEDTMLLRLVAARAATAIERADAHDREHEIAEALQRTLLPGRLPAIEGADIAARYLSGTVDLDVGGDWYDVFGLADGSIALTVGDVMGRGVNAAVAMGQLRHVLQAFAHEGLGPGETLTRVNSIALSGDLFATAIYAVIPPDRTSIRVANAGHPPPLIRTPGGAVFAVDVGRSLPLGTNDEPCAEAELEIRPGSTIVLYTDGLIERPDRSIDDGVARISEILANADSPVHQLVDELVSGLDAETYRDDRAVLAIRLGRAISDRMSLRILADPTSLAGARERLREWLGMHGASPDEIFEIVFAVNEACANAIEHPLDVRDPEITIEAEVSDDRVIVVVNDRGRWRHDHASDDRGRGFDYMTALMENVEVSRSSDGTSVRLERSLESPQTSTSPGAAGIR